MPISSEKIINKQYIPACLKRTAIGWLIEYYALHPQDQTLVRKQIKLNRERKRFSKQSDFKQYANDIVCRINARLAGGWSPFMQEDNSRLYTPLSVVMNEYLTEKEKELRPATLMSYRSFCRMFGTWVEKETPQIYMSIFNRVLAVRYLDYIYKERNVSARTWNNQLKMGRAFFSWAKEKCYVKENPFETIKTKREQEKMREIIPPTVRKNITEYLTKENPRFLVVCQLVFTSLIRPKEIMNIRLQDISLENRYIFIPGENAKTHNARYAAMNQTLIDNLTALHLERYPLDYYLFGGDLSPAKKHCTHTRFNKEWLKMRKALKLPKEMQLYSLRDTGINNLLKCGIDPLSVMQHADHHDLQMTTRYANHADPNLTRLIYEKAPEF